MEVNIPFLHNVDWGGMAPRMLAILTVRFRLALQPLLCLCLTQAAAAYSVLTHEAIIDSAWKDNIAPLLLKRFPDATEDELRKAHAYAYGGAIIQDMGYYPFGSKMF